MIRRSGFVGAFLLLMAMAVWIPAASASVHSPGLERLFLRPGAAVRFDGIGVYVPKPGREVANFSLTTHGEIGLVVSTDMAGRVHIRRFAATAKPSRVSTAPAACDDSFQPAGLGMRWVSPLDWHFNASSTPSRNNVDNVETDMRSAVTHITNESNNCTPHRPDSVSATAAYQGRNARGVNINSNNTCQDGTDNVSEIGFGTIPDGRVADACEWGGKGVIGEADILMNKHDPNILWTTDESTTCSISNHEFNVDNIITHERGHSFGLADVTASGHDNLTMWHLSPACQTSKETLGLGDMLTLEALY